MDKQNNLPAAFFESVLDALVEQLAVIDSRGKIVFVNQSWKSFGTNNNGSRELVWEGVSYLDCCLSAAEGGDCEALTVSKGIEEVISGKQPVFSCEYPCHSPEVKRWFLMRMAPLNLGEQTFFVITHQDITERKLAEEALAEIATRDPLTNIANRRRFEEFADENWRISLRNRSYVSIVMIDIDRFKLINDRLGHAFGDKCLVELAKILDSVTRRPTDLCARYGGEEFILYLGDTRLSDAVRISDKIMVKLHNLVFPDISEADLSYLSVSIGVAAAIPDTSDSLNALIHEADACLYEAKRNGRDRVEFNRQQRMRELAP